MTSKMYKMIISTRTVEIFQVAWSLPVCQMVANSHFYDDFMTFFFDESFFQAMESNSKTFNKPSAVI